MSFSVLPPELKEWTAFLVKEQDERYRRVHGDARKTSEDWYGRGLLALSQVDKQMRELVLPIRYSIIPQSFNLARLPFEQLESWSTSDAAQVCRSLCIGTPVIYESRDDYAAPRPAWRDYAQQEGFDASDTRECWRALRLAFSYLDRLLSLRHISFDTDDCYDKRELFQSIRDVAGVPALAKRITTWTCGGLPGSQVASLLTIDSDSPQTVSVSVNCRGYDNDDSERNLISLIDALRSCRSLSRLELKVWRRRRMQGPVFDPHWRSQPPAFAALRYLTLNFVISLDDSVLPFLTSLPALEVLEFNALNFDPDYDEDDDDDGMATFAATVSVKSNPPPLAIFPSLTTLKLARSTFPAALKALAQVEAANLQSATLVFYHSDEVERGTAIYSVSPSLISSIQTQNPLLHSLALAPRGDPRKVLPQQFNDLASTLSASNLTLSVQWPSVQGPSSHFPFSPAGPATTPSVPSRPPVEEADDLLQWATAELAKAKRVGDDGAARLLRDSLKGVIELQDRIAEGYASSRSALL
ncbi:hypothetical protein JCM10213_005117 [Rhodosporidiobolus nylandii]